MATLYELTDQYKMLQNFIEENNVEGFELALSQIKGEIGEKLEGYAMVLKNIESDITGIKTEEKRLADRRKVMESNLTRIKENMADALLTVEGNRVKTEKFTFSFRKSTSVQINNDAAIPPQFIKVEKTISRADLAKALKAGEQIEGAQLVENQSLSIR
ncbi:siphovirus Gp157 family protein [Lysinibacillus pakistanensis]|uniref:Siphovirus Gp157 family protein n=1 Tax=Lysinibacillus pakistanensis TaxID=759811 RepID=A0AAX3WR65_9BACI|nr:siphovirus Gp157 family protein [Lysinibacillus pakistanensis]MDM5229661.1 siphovirus Gp157 family protein [Lysinibacillus pakistanensis]WHY45278.1 siphovirus Gp157 family protein [Lysinibacillus pakistanensis]WHY50286.1 siphovirus Gp157 family protein [Lysinibacillus pakistanensis]